MKFHEVPKPEAVCLDLDNTLYAYAPCNIAGMRAVYTKLERQFGISRSDAAAVFTGARHDIKEQLGPTASSHSRLLYFQRMLERMGMGSQAFLALDLEQTFWRAYLREAVLYDGAREFLYLLRRHNIPICLVTDLTAAVQFRKIIHLELDGLIDHIVTSEEAGADKPDPRIFRLALAKLGLPAENVWMLGDDSEKDIKGAAECGMHGVLVGKAGSKSDHPSFAALSAIITARS